MVNRDRDRGQDRDDVVLQVVFTWIAKPLCSTLPVPRHYCLVLVVRRDLKT